MPQETKSMPPAHSAAQQQQLPGWTVDLSDDALSFEVLEKAFDYRGDVTLTLKDGTSVSGYLFDRRKGKSLSESSVRLMGAASDDKITVCHADIARVAFSDRDPAAGKSFETWVKKYVEKKMAGESANIFAEPLAE